jgi:hypothetical protein
MLFTYRIVVVVALVGAGVAGAFVVVVVVVVVVALVDAGVGGAFVFVVPLVAALAFQGRGQIVVVVALVTAGVGGALVVVVALVDTDVGGAFGCCCSSGCCTCLSRQRPNCCGSCSGYCRCRRSFGCCCCLLLWLIPMWAELFVVIVALVNAGVG